MICKHCGEEVIKNKVTRSPEPFVYYPWKHANTYLIGCYDEQGNPTGYKAQPGEEKGNK